MSGRSKNNVQKVAAAEEMLQQYGDVGSRWRLRYSQMNLQETQSGTVEGQKWVDGRLSEALLFAAYLLTEYKHVEIADLHGGTTIHMRG